MRLSTKLLLTTCVPPALIWVVGIYVEQVSQRRLRVAIEEAAKVEVRSVQEEIDRLLTARTKSWGEFGASTEVHRVLREANKEHRVLDDPAARLGEIEEGWRSEDPIVKGAAMAKVLDRDLSDDISLTLDKMRQLANYEVFTNVILTDTFGATVARGGEVSQYLHGEETWWKEAERSGDYIGDVTVRDLGRGRELVFLDYCQRIHDVEGEFIGMLKTEVNIEAVMQIVDSYARRGGRDRGLVLLNREGQLIRIGNRGTGTKTLADGSRYLVPTQTGEPEGTQIRVDESGREQVYTWAVPPQESIVRDLGWVAVHTAEADTVLAPVRQLRNTVILASAVATFIGITVMWVIVFPLSRRVTKMAEATKQIGKGALETRIKVTGRDELSALGHEFNRMTSRLEDARGKLMVAMARAEEASKAKGDFLATMSHEIRTPMNAIMGMTELTLGTELSEEQRNYQHLVEQSAQALLMLLNDILDYSKIEAGKLELEQREFDLRDSIGDILQTLSPRAAEKDLELAFRVEPGIPTIVIGDLVRLRQVIVNLVGNAIKFTEEGEILVSVEKRRDLEWQMELLFKVKDTGIGVRADRQDSIFELFAQADTSTTREFGGSGLGLSISKRIVEKMGGEIWLESVEGRGSTFQFTGVFGLGEVASSELAGLGALDGLPVLVVDDNKTQREIVGELLENWSMTGILCADAGGALRKLEKMERSGEEVKLVLLDRVMPGADGFELARRIRRQPKWASVPIIMLSTVSSAGRTEDKDKAGIVKVVSKPIKQSILLDAIMQAMGVGTRLPGRERRNVGQRPREVGPMHVLLAEDGKVNQIVAVRLLERRGHRVTVVENGQAAVACVEEGGFDAVLMDIQMPIMSGYEASRAIRDRESCQGKHIPIIAMTAHAMPGDREECLAAGMDDYVSKPIESEELYEVVERYAPVNSRKETAVIDHNAMNDVHPRINGEGERFDRAVFDPDGFRLRIRDENLMCELIKIFEDDVKNLLADIHDAEKQSDSEELHQASHRMKGLIGNYCASRAMDAVSELDDIARAGRVDQVGKHVTVLDEEVGALKEALSEFREELEQKLQPSG